MYTYVYSGIIHKSQKVEVTQVSINERMDKQNVVYIYSFNGILFSLKKGGNSDTYYNMDEPEDIMLSEISSRKRTSIV